MSAPDRLRSLRIVLVAPSHPGNIGAAARAMLTMGLTRLVLVRPRRFPDPEAVALASGATVVLDGAEVVATLDAGARGLCRRRSGSRPGRASSPGACWPCARRPPKPSRTRAHGDVALVFGTEMSGLSNAELARCGIVATIPANADYASLNLAAAVQVVAYELRLAATGGDVWRAPRFAPATVDEIEALYAHGTATLAAMRFLDPRMPKRLLPRLRRLFSRAALEKEEVNILRGILARIDQLLGRR